MLGQAWNWNAKYIIIIIITTIISSSSGSSSNSISKSNSSNSSSSIAPAVDSADVSANFSRAACVGLSLLVSVGLPSLSRSADKMTASKAVCGVYKKAFYGRQKFLHYSGSCSSRLHQTCLRVSDNEYSTYSANCESTYQCDSCRKKPGAGRSNDTRCRSTPKADYNSDILVRSNLDVNLHAHLESISTNGYCTNKLTENLVYIVIKFSD